MAKKEPGLREQFRKMAHDAAVAVGAAPDYKLYDPKTKTLYEVDRGMTGHHKITAIKNPTAEQSRFSENINTFQRNLGEKLYDMAVDYNTSGPGRNGLRNIPHGEDPPTSVRAIKAAYENVTAGYKQGLGTDQGTLSDRLHDNVDSKDHEPDERYKRLQDNEVELDTLKPQVDALVAVDNVIGDAPKAGRTAAPAFTPPGQ